VTVTETVTLTRIEEASVNDRRRSSERLARIAALSAGVLAFAATPAAAATDVEVVAAGRPARIRLEQPSLRQVATIGKRRWVAEEFIESRLRGDPPSLRVSSSNDQLRVIATRGAGGWGRGGHTCELVAKVREREQVFARVAARANEWIPTQRTRVAERTWDIVVPLEAPSALTPLVLETGAKLELPIDAGEAVLSSEAKGDDIASAVAVEGKIVVEAKALGGTRVRVPYRLGARRFTLALDVEVVEKALSIERPAKVGEALRVRATEIANATGIEGLRFVAVHDDRASRASGARVVDGDLEIRAERASALRAIAILEPGDRSKPADPAHAREGQVWVDLRVDAALADERRSADGAAD